MMASRHSQAVKRITSLFEKAGYKLDILHSMPVTLEYLRIAKEFFTLALEKI